MSEWITDRLPTAEDAVHYNVLVWNEEHKQVWIWTFDGVDKGQPWQPIPRPAPYVKPERWTVELDSIGLWSLRLNGEHYNYMPASDGWSKEAVQRICDIYNEVLP